jgi:hypothetical protein
VLCLRRSDLGIQRKGLAPVVAGLLVLAGAVVAVGEVVVGSGLLVDVARLGG